MKAARSTALRSAAPAAHEYVYPPRDGITLRCRRHPNCSPIILAIAESKPMVLARLRERGELVEES